MAEKLNLLILSPERVFFEGEASMVEFNTTEGEIGVLPGHISLTSVIAPGILRIHQDQEIREAALLSGFVEILPDQVRILAQAVEWPDEIDLHRAQEAKVRAERRLQGGEDIDAMRAETALKRSLVRIRVASPSM